MMHARMLGDADTPDATAVLVHVSRHTKPRDELSGDGFDIGVRELNPRVVRAPWFADDSGFAHRDERGIAFACRGLVNHATECDRLVGHRMTRHSTERADEISQSDRWTAAKRSAGYCASALPLR